MAGAVNFTWTRKILCIGVKWSSASACRPTWSSVERVRVSQMFFAGHHKAWSDQSFGFAGRRRNEMKTLIILFETIFHDDDFLWPNFPDLPRKCQPSRQIIITIKIYSVECSHWAASWWKCGNAEHISFPPKADIRKHFWLIWPWKSICLISWRAQPFENFFLHGIFAHHVETAMGVGLKKLKSSDKNRRNEDVFVGENRKHSPRQSNGMRRKVCDLQANFVHCEKKTSLRHLELHLIDSKLEPDLIFIDACQASINVNSEENSTKIHCHKFTSLLTEALLTLKIAVNYAGALRRLIGVNIFITPLRAAGNFRWLRKLAWKSLAEWKIMWNWVIVKLKRAKQGLNFSSFYRVWWFANWA